MEIKCGNDNCIDSEVYPQDEEFGGGYICVNCGWVKDCKTGEAKNDNYKDFVRAIQKAIDMSQVRRALIQYGHGLHPPT